MRFECSKFFECFTLSDDTRVEIGSLLLVKISKYLFGDKELIDYDIKNLKIIDDDELGEILTLEEIEDFTNSDGIGYYCRNVDGSMMKSRLRVNLDFPIPDYYREKFDHALWYNR